MHLKVVCLNIWIGGLIYEPMVNFLEEERADIYLLQEVYAGDDDHYAAQYRAFDALKERLGLPYHHFAPAFIESVGGTHIVQGNAVYSRYPLKEVAVTYYDVPFGERKNEWSSFHVTPRNLQHLTVKFGSTKVHLFNTQGIWGEDGFDHPRRIEMAQHILREIGDLQPVILAGDFNVQPGTTTISLLEAKLQSVFKDELKTTFNLKRKNIEKFPGFATAVVDMFFVSPDIQIITHQCPDIDISDHLPLIVKCEIEA